MTRHMITGTKIRLRAPEPTDVDAMFRWENDSQSWVNGRTRAPMSRHALWQYVESYDADIMHAGQARFIIVETSSAEPIGCIDLYDIDTLNRRAAVGIYIEPSWRNRDMATQSLLLLADYCQQQLGLHQLWAVIASDNTPSRALFHSVGFKECGRLRSWLRQGEHYTDALLTQRLLTT